MKCSCEINGTGGDDRYYECNTTIRTCISNCRKCHECEKELEAGEQYEHAECYYEEERNEEEDQEDPNIHITCMDCLSLRNNMFGDWAYSMLWEDFGYHVEDCNALVPEECIAKLTPVARGKVCAIIEKVWEIQNEKESTD